MKRSLASFWLVISVMSLSAIGCLTALSLSNQASAQARQTDQLSIVEFCNTQGFKCQLRFVDSYRGENVVAIIQNYLARAGDTTLGTQVSVQADCSPGWIASVQAQDGTVSSGGLLTGSATVCGYSDPVAALKAALQACDSQSANLCRNANQIRAVWGQWDGVTASRRPVEPGRPYDPLSYPDGQQCSSTVPIFSTSSCLPEAVHQLKAAGVR